MKKIILFDMDGTLLNTVPALSMSLEESFKHYFPNREYKVCNKEFKAAVSYGRDALASVAFNTKTPDKEWGLYAETIYSKIMLKNTTFFEGIEDILQMLIDKNIKYGIVTSKPYYLTSQLCKNNTFLRSSSIIVCPEDVTNKKPDPESLILACDRSGFEIKEAIYIGDSDSDIYAANACDMDSILVKYGYLPSNIDIDKLNPTYIAETPKELKMILQRDILN